MKKMLSRLVREWRSSVRQGGWASGGDSECFTPLEGRTLMTLAVLSPVADSSVAQNSAATVVSLAGRYDNAALNGTIVKFATDAGDINVLLYDQANSDVTRTTPLTVANFLNYVNAGRYNSTIIHRSVPGFVIQGGGFTRPTANNTLPSTITTNAPVTNEPGNTNARGTIAMAKVGGDANSATDQWFFNLANNASNLDSQNGGFTVFGRIINGLTLMDNIATLQTIDVGQKLGGSAGGVFAQTPVGGYDGSVVRPSNYLGMNISTIQKLTYSVSSSNTGVVSPTLSGTNLTLTYGSNITGSATVTVTITCADGTTINDDFVVRINSAPVIGNLTPTASNIGRNSIFSLTLGSANDDGGIARVDFYRDTNGDGQLTGADSLIGSDTSAAGGWSLSTDSNGFDLGTQRYFARAIDTDGLVGNATSTTVNIVNAGPVVSALTVSPNPAEGRVPVTLTATATDPDGTVAFVRFYRDSNLNGAFDAGTDTLLGEDNNGSDGYTATVDTSTVTFGSVRYFAVGTDLEGTSGAPATAVGVINAPFSVGSLTSSPATALRNAQIVLTAGDIFVPAGKRLKALEFYADTNNNGQFDAGVDKKIGSAGSLKNGVATVKVSTKGLPVGDAHYFARVQDNLNAWSPATSLTVAVVNNAPTVGSVKPSVAVVKNIGDVIALSVSNTKDLDGKVTSVRYYRESDGTNTLESTFDPQAETLLAIVTNASGGFKFSTQTIEFSVGRNRFYAVVVDNDGAASGVVSTTATINAAPTITTLAVNPTSGPSTAPFTFSASGVGDSDGTIKQVEFFIDTNLNGAFDARADKSIGKARLAGGVWSLIVGAKKFKAGQYTVFALATDNLGGASIAASVQFTVT